MSPAFLFGAPLFLTEFGLASAIALAFNHDNLGGVCLDPISWTGELCGVRLCKWSVEGNAGARRPRYEARRAVRDAAECPRREIGTASPAARSVDEAER